MRHTSLYWRWYLDRAYVNRCYSEYHGNAQLYGF